MTLSHRCQQVCKAMTIPRRGLFEILAKLLMDMDRFTVCLGSHVNWVSFGFEMRQIRDSDELCFLLFGSAQLEWMYSKQCKQEHVQMTYCDMKCTLFLSLTVSHIIINLNSNVGTEATLQIKKERWGLRLRWLVAWRPVATLYILTFCRCNPLGYFMLLADLRLYTGIPTYQN